MISYYLLTETVSLFTLTGCLYTVHVKVHTYMKMGFSPTCFIELIGFVYHALYHSYICSAATWRMLWYMCEWIAYVPCIILVIMLQTIWSPSSLHAMCRTLKQMAQWGY